MIDERLEKGQRYKTKSTKKLERIVKCRSTNNGQIHNLKM